MYLVMFKTNLFQCFCQNDLGDRPFGNMREERRQEYTSRGWGGENHPEIGARLGQSLVLREPSMTGVGVCAAVALLGLDLSSLPRHLQLQLLSEA